MINPERKTFIKKGLDKFGRESWNVSQEGREIAYFPVVNYLSSVAAHQGALDYVGKMIDRYNPRSKNPQTLEQFEALKEVKLFSPVGPCLSRYRLVRKSKKSATLAYINGQSISIQREPVSWVHEKPCGCCGGQYMD